MKSWLLNIVRHRAPALARLLIALLRRTVLFARRNYRKAVRALPALVLLAVAIRLLWLPDHLDQLRAARHLVHNGEVQQAFMRYQQLYDEGDKRPELLLQLAQVRLLRGEPTEAEILLAQALSGALPPRLLSEGQLAYGWAIALQGRRDDAEAVWRSLPDAFQGYVGVLRGETALHSGDLQAALAAVQQSLAAPLPPEWRAHAAYRLALLVAATDPRSAEASLAAAPADLSDVLVLTPLGSWPESVWRNRTARLRQALQQAPEARTMLLASLLAEEGLQRAAHRLLQQVADKPLSEQMLMFDARLRLGLGDGSGALAVLQEGAQRFPQSADLLRLIALVQAEQQLLVQATGTLTQAAQLQPYAPDNAVVLATLKRVERKHIEAAAVYAHAIELAELDRQPLYHLHAARFYYDTTWQVCEAGVIHARQAATGLADNPEAWMLLGDMLLRCGSNQEALETGDTMVERWPDQPAGHFIRGEALLRLERREEGRQALLHAANLAPASEWRVRAEQALKQAALLSVPQPLAVRAVPLAE